MIKKLLKAVNFATIAITILLLVYCGNKNAPPTGAIDFPVPTKMLVNAAEMQVGTSGAYRISQATSATTEPMPNCADISNDNTIFNLGFQMACSAGVVLRKSLTGDNTGEVRCDDAVDDGIIGAIACNVSATTVTMAPFTGDDGKAFALSFENFNSFTGAGVWTGDEKSLPLAMQLWMGASTATVNPGIALQLTDKTQGDLWIDYAVTDAATSGNGLLYGRFNANISTCDVNNITEAGCVFHEVQFARQSTCPSNADVRSAHIKAYADSTSGFSFAKVQYYVELCTPVTPTGWTKTIDAIRGNSMLVNGKRYLQIDFLDNTGTPITTGITTNTPYNTGFLDPFLTSMGTGSTGLCFPAGFTADQTGFWTGTGGWNAIRGAGAKNIVDGQCDGSTVSFDSFGTAPTDFNKADTTSAAIVGFNTKPTSNKNQ